MIFDMVSDGCMVRSTKCITLYTNTSRLRGRISIVPGFVRPVLKSSVGSGSVEYGSDSSVTLDQENA